MWNKILRSGFLCSIVQLTDLLTDHVIHALASDVILTRLCMHALQFEAFVFLKICRPSIMP